MRAVGRHAYTIWVEASAVLMLVGVYGTWVTVRGSGVPGTASGNRGWVVLAVALLAAGVCWFRAGTRSSGLYVVSAGVVAVAASAYDRTHLAAAIGGGKVVAASAGAGWGLDVAFAASVSLVVAGAAWVVSRADLPWAWLPAAVDGREPPTAIELAAHENEQTL